ncbi:glycoside hydrolase family 13 protein [Pedobacter sp. Leaf170]|uniref:glycoside hydrolase family 13 protein n=1 Tax=Pedobacter sp. Leaf170 TaxID=2876558 RepID=UPI001E3C14DC|nr:glycoside hydrolase family 13 protein [Pedobacter sp. Leaf170]
MCKKIIYLSLLALLCNWNSVFAKITINRVEPANWWVGMKKTEFQILVYGPGIGNAKVTLNYQGVSLKEAVKVENPNYVFLYVNVSKSAKAGNVSIDFSNGADKFTYNYPLKNRTDKSGALGFNAADVLYLITPDRFANGNAKNDNLDSVLINRKSPNARHGGDYEGVRQKLDYMKDLGITTVWLNPIQENRMRGGSYHGYAITDFYQSDPRFGSNEEFKALTQETHNKGMKMVMDMVLNHCGSSHWWMRDLPSKDWINNDGVFLQTNHATVSVMDVHASPTERNTFLNGWFTRGMPDLNQRNPHLATYLIQNSIWWIEYARIDGIRQDTYSYMDFDFLARWNKEVYDEYPNFNIVGETWYNKKTSPAWWQAGSTFDKKDSHLKTPMDFSLTFTMQKAFDGETDNGYLNEIFEDVAQDFVYADPYQILTFLDNHDLGRFSRKEDKDLKRFKQGLAFLLTTRGIPQIYYGTEVLMIGTKEDGDGRLRVDFPGGWQEDKKDEFTKAGRSEIQNEAWDYLQNLLQWRKTSKAITGGKLIHYAPKNGVYVYGRKADNQSVMVVLNSSLKDQSISMERFTDITSGYSSGKDIISGKNMQISKEISIPAKGQYIFELNK